MAGQRVLQQDMPEYSIVLFAKSVSDILACPSLRGHHDHAMYAYLRHGVSASVPALRRHSGLCLYTIRCLRRKGMNNEDLETYAYLTGTAPNSVIKSPSGIPQTGH